MSIFSKNDNKSNLYHRVRSSILDAIEHTYGNIYPRMLAWNLSLQIHVPAYIIFSICMDLVNRGEVIMHHDKIHGKSNFPSYKKIPNLKSYLGIKMSLDPLCSEKNISKWDMFREIILYYIKCIRLEEGTIAKVWQNTLNEQFIFLSDTGRWYPRDNVLWRKLIPFANISGTIIDLWRNSESTTLVLGYPVNAIVEKKGNILLCPVFCYVLDHRITPAGLEVKARLTRPFVNAEWLDHAFSRSSEKRTFLEACGIYTSQNKDDFAGEDESDPDFPLLAQILSSADERHVRERLDPCCISDRPIDASCRSGIYNRAIIVASRSSPYSRSLITELKTIARAPDMVLNKTALSYFFADAPKEETVCRPASGAVVSEQALTGTQRRAVASLLELPLTTIQGPPGTGKSQVVSNAVLNMRLRGQSVLISSYNHKAIDAVMDRLASSTEKVLVVRCNSKEDPTLSFSMQNAIKVMLAMPREDDTDGERLESFHRLLKARGQESLKADEVERCGKELGEFGEELAAQISAFPWLSRLTDKDFKDLALYREAARLARECADETPLQTFFLRGNIGALLNLRRAGRVLRRRCVEVPIYSWRADMRPLAEAFEAASRVLELKRGIEEKESRLKNMPTLENLGKEVARLSDLVKDQLAAIKKHDIARREKLPQEVDRTQLKGLECAMSTVKSALASSDILKLLYEELPQKLPAVLRCFPCWAVSSLSIRKYIPLVPGLFDLVLIDEASQSNIPSAIPLLFRAKRAGIIGDPSQLRFVSRMTTDREALLQHELKISSLADLRFSFTENSLYDLASSSHFATPFLLDCTFRSTGDIAAYSNMLFYGGRLQVGTDENSLRRPKGATEAIEWRDIHGEIRRGAGQRSCWCDEEIEQVVQLVKQLLLTARFDGSIGIVTPFKEQAQRIEDSLEIAEIDHRLLDRAGVHADTAHGFQGDERDVMIFSLCAGDTLTPGALHFLRENPNLFNVAVSRARAMLYVVGNREWAKRCGIHHIELLAAPAELRQPPPRKTEWYPYESPYEKLLAEALQKVGLDPLPQVPVRYRRLDLALRDPAFPECRLDIEVDGACHRDAGGHRKGDDLWRTIELEAAGWRVIRFWTYQLREDLPGCVARVQNVWNEMREQNRSKAEE